MVCRQSGRPDHATVTEASKMPTAFKKHPIQTIHARGQLGLAMVLWHGCEIDKFKEQGRPEERWYAAVAPVLPLDKHEMAFRNGVAAGERAPYFFVPANDPLGIPVSYVDLRNIWSVKQSLLVDRIATLSDPGLHSLYSHLFGFLTAMTLASSTACPHCSKPVSLADLVVRPEGEVPR